MVAFISSSCRSGRAGVRADARHGRARFALHSRRGNPGDPRDARSHAGDHGPGRARGDQSRRHWTFDFMGSRAGSSACRARSCWSARSRSAAARQLRIDFVGGTQIQVTLAHPARSPRSARDRVAASEERQASIASRRAAGLATRQAEEAHLQLPDRHQDAERAADRGRLATNTVRGLLDARYGIVGEQLQRHSSARASARRSAIRRPRDHRPLLAIAAYITLRFQWKYAVR